MTAELKREVLELVDLVQKLLRTQDDERKGKRRIILDMPEATQMLMAWLQLRRRMELRGKGGPSPWPVQGLHPQTLHVLARNYCAFVLNEHFHMELLGLGMGTHPVLRRPVTDIATKGDPL
ncbi:hypothetical protein [Mesorhizobium sophorae]|uniref:hypothetical protein n=1 Tax=Mesorhizobium sophorae TaxID=1300294 RepID=UPI000BA3980B|nr:hypothetical protein [Mesorhizobium sophorae]